MPSLNNWTGERLETFISNETMLEHLHRYAIVLELVNGKKVLDIACGEGYGVNLLAQCASHVTGVDIDHNTIQKAKRKYQKENTVFLAGSALQIPAENHSFDIVTCFETIEHLTEHESLLRELKRVLAPGGILLISTPEKLNYSDNSHYKNPFHQKELYGQEFKELLNHFFSYSFFFTQSSCCGSVILAEKNNSLGKFYSGNYTTIKTGSAVSTMYWIGMASDNALTPFSGSFFQHEKNLSQLLFEESEALKKTITYRAGNILLSPFKFIRTLFRK
ncbi:MAG TPA: class I SAM-dependent methyltransferase [Chitinophagaceae bacterium]